MQLGCGVGVSKGMDYYGENGRLCSCVWCFACCGEIVNESRMCQKYVAFGLADGTCAQVLTSNEVSFWFSTYIKCLMCKGNGYEFENACGIDSWIHQLQPLHFDDGSFKF